MPARDREPVIAVSAHTVAEVRAGVAQGADFAVLAPIFEKAHTHVRGIGLDALRAAATAPPATAPPATPGEAAGSDGRRPLVVIRFARPDVEYEQALYLAVSEALARKPDADFDVVAVAPRKVVAKSPLAANESQKNADAVMRALANMGLPAERMTLSATTSDAVDSNEVHLYVR
jgi:hypothetical protein